MTKQEAWWPVSGHDRTWQWRALHFADRYAETMEPMSDILGIWGRAALRTIDAATAALKAKEGGDA